MADRSVLLVSQAMISGKQFFCHSSGHKTLSVAAYMYVVHKPSVKIFVIQFVSASHLGQFEVLLDMYIDPKTYQIDPGTLLLGNSFFVPR